MKPFAIIHLRFSRVRGDAEIAQHFIAGNYAGNID
jgi:hypothetical protein